MKWLSIRDVAKELDIADPTLRRYIDYHKDFIKTKKSENLLMVSEESLEVIQQIREWYSAGHRRRRVHDLLRDRFTMSIVISDEDQGLNVGDVAKVIERLLHENADLKKQVQRLEELMQANNQLIREISSSRKEVRPGFFERFFRKSSR